MTASIYDTAMITDLLLGNFKAFAEQQRIPIRPLTLIFGANSAGKSSILHGLLYASHAIKTGELDAHNVGDDGEIDLGGYQRFVHGHNWKAPVKLGFAVGYDDFLENRHRQGSAKPPTFEANFQIQKGPIYEGTCIVTHAEYLVDGEFFLSFCHGDHMLAINYQHPVFQEWVFNLAERMTSRKLTDRDRRRLAENIDEEIGDYRPQSDSFLPYGVELESGKIIDDVRIWPRLRDLYENSRWSYMSALSGIQIKVSAKSSFRDFAKLCKMLLLMFLVEFFQKTYGVFERSITPVRYIGPLRAYPPRNMFLGEFTTSEFEPWYRIAKDDSLRREINNWLGDKQKMATPYELTSRCYVRTGKKQSKRFLQDPDKDVIYDLPLLDTRTQTFVSPRDIGMGVSQVVPILVAACGSRREIHAIEQPELHLHPALQADLGDLLIRSAFGKQKNTFLLETHSEHLILRILRRIRESSEKVRNNMPRIRPDDVSILFVSPTANGSIVKQMPVTPDGDFAEPWPGGFFTDRLKDLP